MTDEQQRPTPAPPPDGRYYLVSEMMIAGLIAYLGEQKAKETHHFLQELNLETLFPVNVTGKASLAEAMADAPDGALVMGEDEPSNPDDFSLAPPVAEDVKYDEAVDEALGLNGEQRAP